MDFCSTKVHDFQVKRALSPEDPWGTPREPENDCFLMIFHQKSNRNLNTLVLNNGHN